MTVTADLFTWRTRESVGRFFIDVWRNPPDNDFEAEMLVNTKFSAPDISLIISILDIS
jgi:hypothetical protein